MTVQARFYVRTLTKNAYLSKQYADTYAKPVPAGEIFLSPVTRGGANAEWASATPSGEVKLTTHGPAFEWFEARLGEEIAITFADIPAVVEEAVVEE